jgi:hypothetical protein
MGKEKQFPGKLSGILKEKRVLAFPLLLIAIIAFGLVLQGCEEREEIIEYGCGDHEDDYVIVLPDLNDKNDLSIIVELCLKGENGEIIVEADPLSEAEKEAALAVNEPFAITHLITYFQVKNAKTDKIITDFDTPLEMQVKYTAEAWEEATKQDFKHPRVAYLIWKDASWADAWVEFTDVSFKLPGTGGDNHGYLNFSIDQLDDPLIGGL